MSYYLTYEETDHHNTTVTFKSKEEVVRFIGKMITDVKYNVKDFVVVEGVPLVVTIKAITVGLNREEINEDTKVSR